jgi:hypothetical protein
MNLWLALFTLAAVGNVAVAFGAFRAMSWYERRHGGPGAGWWLGLLTYAVGGAAVAALVCLPVCWFHLA